MPWQAADLGALGLTEAACRTAVQWVGDDGGTSSGEVAIAHALRAGRRPWPVAGRVLLAVQPVSGWVYRWVSAHRSSLPGGPPACATVTRSPSRGAPGRPAG